MLETRVTSRSVIKGGDGNDVTLTTLPGVGNAGDPIDTGRIAAFSVMTIIAIALSVKTKRRIRSS
jgi:hypothetical protein